MKIAYNAFNDISGFMKQTAVRSLVFTCSVICMCVFAYTVHAADFCCNCKAPGDLLNVKCINTNGEALGSGDCSKLPQKFNLADGWTCDASQLSTAKCKSVDQQGICVGKPMTVDEAKRILKGDAIPDPGSAGQAETPDAPPIPFELNIPIPGFDTKTITPGIFADYVIAFMRFGISVVAVVTTIMFMYGAFLYLLGATFATASKGKKYMIDAVMGLLLVLSSTLILRTINPELTSFKELTVQEVDAMIGEMSPAGIEPTGRPGTPGSGIVEAIINQSKAVGVDPCLMLAICEHETGLKATWNGSYANNPKEKAISFGACQVDVRFLHDKNPLVKKVREYFPDFPPPSDKAKGFISDTEEKVRRGDWMLTNLNGSAWVAANVLAWGIRSAKGNELVAVAGYGAGPQSIKRWQQANACSPQDNLKIKDATDATLKSSCIPVSVGIVSKGDESKACKEDKFNCKDAKANAKAVLIGTCESTGQPCYAMTTDSFVRYVMSAYPRMVSKYGCNK